MSQVVQLSWKGVRELGSGMSLDPSVYSGVLGTAFTCLRAYEATGNQQDLTLCAEIVDTCSDVARGTRYLLAYFIFLLVYYIFLIWVNRYVGGSISLSS